MWLPSKTDSYNLFIFPLFLPNPQADQKERSHGRLEKSKK